ncbi:MAG: Dabb family protein [Phycisphaerales bacterium]|nr:Dabb family protein [Phycisphaerales bacterium]
MIYPTRMRNRSIARTLPAAIILGLAAGLSGCSTSSRSAERDRTTVSSPGVVHHPVFFTLNDPADRAALIADCDALLPVIPGVTAYACGVHHESGRSTVDSNYDVGLYIAFDSPASYASYVTHPNHVTLVERWKPHLKSLHVYDIISDRAVFDTAP